MAQKRSIDETWRHLGTLLNTVTPEECANYFATPDTLPSKHEGV